MLFELHATPIKNRCPPASPEHAMAGRCEVNEDGYEEQIIIPKEQRDLAAEEGIGTENKQKSFNSTLKIVMERRWKSMFPI